MSIESCLGYDVRQLAPHRKELDSTLSVMLRRLPSSRHAGPLKILVCILVVLLSGCASIQGYPKDPEATDSTLKRLRPYFDGTKEDSYVNSGADVAARSKLRDEIVGARMRAYDIEFSRFERQLYGSSNTISVGSDLVGLALGGLTATVGGAATKAALGAASTGVLGANTAINKDLYFQKTIPALIAQMEANRAKTKLVIVRGLAQPDSKYTLFAAYSDLDAYQRSGSIPDAISSITQSAGNSKQSADHDIVIERKRLDVAQLPDKEIVQAQIRALKENQVLAVAQTMQPNLSSRSSEIQQLVETLDPTDLRLNGNFTEAKEVLNAWVGEEDMTAANMKQWTDAIAAATK